MKNNTDKYFTKCDILMTGYSYKDWQISYNFIFAQIRNHLLVLALKSEIGYKNY